MSARKSFSADEARAIGEQIGIDWNSSAVKLFRADMNPSLVT